MAQTRIFEFEKLGKNYAKLKSEIGAGKSCSIFGVQNSMRCAFVDFIGKKALYLTSDYVRAEQVTEELESMGKRVCLLRSPSDIFLFKRAGSTDVFESRLDVMTSICEGNFDVIVSYSEALLFMLPQREKFVGGTINLEVGETIDIMDLEKSLVMAGYKREELISACGQFSRRGEVLDIFPAKSDEPVRVDFFDTEIESIKILDLSTQKGTKSIEKVRIYPHCDIIISDDERDKICEKLLSRKQNSNLACDIDLNTQIDEIISRLKLGDRSYSISGLLGLTEHSTIFDYLPSDTIVFIDECKQVYDYLASSDREISARVKQLIADKLTPLFSSECIFTDKKILEKIRQLTAVAFLKITNSNRFFNSDAVFAFSTKPCLRYIHNISQLYDDIRVLQKSKDAVHLFAGSESQASDLKKMLLSHGIDFEIAKGEKVDFEKSQILPYFYSQGFVLPEEKQVFIATYDIFAKRKKSKFLSPKENVFSVPKVGDYVVHQVHGIGICEGVTRLTGNLGTQDYVVIRYRDGDKLYVPTSHLDMLDRFAGAEKPTRLSKIGGQEFSLVKEKVGKSIKKLAINLIELYAKREKIKGHAFSKDNELSLEFDNAFGYTETEDQLICESEIKRDMESEKVMDRLLCGDVGFGKTEVALRACFKAVCDNKQVAFVAPTTILSEQHYNTARARMNEFGVKIEVLNRFKTAAETAKILKDLESGKIDIVFGTHRIFSDDVKFASLGLIVLDEEQKFGVEDKEKLKSKYPSVDVLTLSATPIPRTLNMALTGIRDISIISTPPSERVPIQTYVIEYSDALVKDAICREIERGGQVFVLFNSVERIYTFAQKLKSIVPNATISVAHGQMKPRELEKVIYDFYHKMADVLVSTTIIENGIDIENANTLIIIDSDKFGLSGLYQLRGRVGRGSREAYAYFTYDSAKILTEEAYKRLDAISEFCEFGSGFKLAMRDLEIRGGGNILGAEQSGHLQKIGFDMYTRLLENAIKEIRGEKVEEKIDVLVKIGLDAYISEDYISSSESRMVAYKRISSVEGGDDAAKIYSELESTYGKVPSVTENLLMISLARGLASSAGAFEINGTKECLNLLFDSKTKIIGDSDIAEAVFKFRQNCSIDMQVRPTIKFFGKSDIVENLKVLIKFLIYFNNLKQKQ